MTDSAVEVVSAAIFALALAHTFAAKMFDRLARRYPSHAGLFDLLGEVEVVFGFWAMVLVASLAVMKGASQALDYAESRRYTEPLFVFVVMVVAASKPILQVVMAVWIGLARLVPMRTELAMAWLGLVLVPLLGSFITEPAAMTVAALMLAPQVFRPKIPESVKYLALGVLFVNVSIGGTLTHFAAPPVLMVASTWQWDTAFMLSTFGWKAAVAVLVNGTAAVLALRKHLSPAEVGPQAVSRVPSTVVAAHLAFLVAVVVLAHHPVAFLGVFLLFLGFTQAYERHQDPLIIREALLVGFFLAGLVVLGGMQQWWLRPAVTGLSPQALFYAALSLTAIADNAALTYIGSLFAGISDAAKYSLVAGAVAGGGLTVIANAPNPAGVALLKKGFADESIGALELLLGGLLPTAVAAAAFVWL